MKTSLCHRFLFSVVRSSYRSQSAVGLDWHLILIGAEVWDGCLYGCWFPVGKLGGSREGLRLLAEVNTNTCGVISGEICRESGTAVLTLACLQ